VGGQNLADLSSDDIPYPAPARSAWGLSRIHQLPVRPHGFRQSALLLIINGTPPDGNRPAAWRGRAGQGWIARPRRRCNPIAHVRWRKTAAPWHRRAWCTAGSAAWPTNRRNLDPELQPSHGLFSKDFQSVGVTVINRRHDLPLIANTDHRNVGRSNQGTRPARW